MRPAVAEVVDSKHAAALHTVLCAVRAALAGARFLTFDEAGLQRAVAHELDRHGLAYQREKRFGSRDRVDFFVDGVVLELKVKAPAKAILRQVLRYAEHGDVRAIVVAGTCHSVLRLPHEVSGKPLYAIHLVSF